ncbi:MAG: TonB family protein [Spirochaetales bacterium]|nr:TonB family protein [Spirochaetales bacterium]
MNRKASVITNISVIVFSVVVHVLLFFFSFNLKDPSELEELIPAFPMIDAVVIEAPQVIPPPPVPPPPPPPEPEKEVEPIVDNAVVPDEEAPEPEEEVSPPEEPLPPPPEPVETSAAETSSRQESSLTLPADFLPFYRVEKRPEFIAQAELEYPSQARRQRVEGTVILEADIDADGTIVRINVVKVAGFGFDQAASEMLKASTFSPAFMDGRAVPVRMRFTVKFEL